MSRDGKCPDLYDCRFSDAEMRRLANAKLKAENAKLRAALEEMIELASMMQRRFKSKSDRIEADMQIRRARQAIGQSGGE